METIIIPREPVDLGVPPMSAANIGEDAYEEIEITAENFRVVNRHEECAACHRELSFAWRFCPRCGSRINQ